MIYKHGEITISRQLLEQTRQHEQTWKRLERTALDYENASPEDRADLDRVLQAIDERDDW